LPLLPELVVTTQAVEAEGIGEELEVRVEFWGTRGSIAKPGSSTVRYGGNTSCVEVRSKRGTLVILDCGTGAHPLAKA